MSALVIVAFCLSLVPKMVCVPASECSVTLTGSRPDLCPLMCWRGVAHMQTKESASRETLLRKSRVQAGDIRKQKSS